MTDERRASLNSVLGSVERHWPFLAPSDTLTTRCCVAFGFPQDYEHIGALLIPALGGSMDAMLVLVKKAGLDPLYILNEATERMASEGYRDDESLGVQLSRCLMLEVLEHL